MFDIACMRNAPHASNGYFLDVSPIQLLLLLLLRLLLLLLPCVRYDADSRRKCGIKSGRNVSSASTRHTTGHICIRRLSMPIVCL